MTRATDQYQKSQKEKEELKNRLDTFSNENKMLREELKKIQGQLTAFHENARQQKDAYDQSVIKQQKYLKNIEQSSKEAIDANKLEFYKILSQKDTQCENLEKALALEAIY